MKRYIKPISVILALCALVVSSTHVSFAQEDRKVTILEGQAAIERYAEVTGLSVAQVEAMIEYSRASRRSSEGEIYPMGIGGFYADFTPKCVYDGKAIALYEVGPAFFEIQFSGTALWVGSSSCMAVQCTYYTEAGLDFPGDEIWMYWVQSVWANNISNWCSADA